MSILINAINIFLFFNTGVDLWPTRGDGAVNFFPNFGMVSATQSYFGVSVGKFNSLLGASVIKPDYSLNRDYNSYINLGIEGELAICDSILEEEEGTVGGSNRC